MTEAVRRNGGKLGELESFSLTSTGLSAGATTSGGLVGPGADPSAPVLLGGQCVGDTVVNKGIFRAHKKFIDTIAAGVCGKTIASVETFSNLCYYALIFTDGTKLHIELQAMSRHGRRTPNCDHVLLMAEKGQP
jgi:hypothetical protein